MAKAKAKSMRSIPIVALGVLLQVLWCGISEAKVYFKETFDDEGWRERWVIPTSWKPPTEMGEWKWTQGKWHGGVDGDKGVQTGEDARHYGLIAPLDEPFTQTGDLVLQFSVKHEQKIDCGGAYIKLLGAMDADTFGGDSPYQIMFGPDICGAANAKTHAIFFYEPKAENLLIKEKIRVEKDQLSHVYTLHVMKDGNFEVYIDQQSVQSGSLENMFDFLPPREIKDPNQSKPADWVDEKRIPDPSDTKPEGWDDIPPEIPDPDASKPENWDDEEDGEWEPPLLPNPAFKGPWKPRMMDNPDYKGEWIHPMIPNPDYKSDDLLFQRCNDCRYIGFELWQMKSGTIFDNIIVTDSLEEAQALAEETWAVSKDSERIMFESHAAEESRERASLAEARRKEMEAQQEVEKEKYDESSFVSSGSAEKEAAGVNGGEEEDIIDGEDDSDEEMDEL